MVDQQILLLRKQIDKLEEQDFNLEGWKKSTIVILTRIFFENHSSLKAIKKIKFESDFWGINDVSHYSDNILECKKIGKDIIEACITELDFFGQPEKKKDIQKGININLTQNQTVNINLLISALEDELTVSQFKEVEKLMKSKETLNEKKIKIIDKIKGFGSDVASNILANILTNPSIWGI